MIKNSVKFFQFGKCFKSGFLPQHRLFMSNMGNFEDGKLYFHKETALQNLRVNGYQRIKFHTNSNCLEEEEKEEKREQKKDPFYQYFLYSSIAAIVLLLSLQCIQRQKMKKKIEKIKMLLTIKRIRESGILASDENEIIMENRFEKINVENTDENRREYREVLYNSPGIEKYIGGAILCRETFDQKTKDGVRFVDLLKMKGLEVGLCVDDGWDVNPETGESLTRGMNKLCQEVSHAKENGASFVKWRTVFHMTTDNSSPTDENFKKNINDIVKYVQIAQSYGMVPIVEPEVSVFASDDLSLDQVYDTTKNVLSEVFKSLENPSNKTDVSRIILKPNMVVCKKFLDCPHIVGEMTIKAFQEAIVPKGCSIMFLSGGMNEKQSRENLNQIAKKNAERVNNQWRFSYSFGRALQESCRNSWRGKTENTEEARSAFLKQAKDCYNASYGMYYE